MLAATQIPNVFGAAETREFFVSTTGNLATLERARDAVRAAKAAHPNARITVTVRGGTYYLPSTLVFTPEDSGTAGAPIVWRAAPGEKVVLSGGRRIPAHWKTTDGKIYFADVPDARDGAWDFDQLFVNDRRAVKARYPNLLPHDPDGKSWLYVGGQRQDRILAGLARAGDFLEYSFTVPAAKEYDIWLGVSCPGVKIEDHLAVSIDGKRLPGTAITASKSFRTVRYTRIATLPLSAAKHTIRLENVSAKEFRIHLSRLILTDRSGLAIPDYHVPDAVPQEHRIDLRPEDRPSKTQEFSSIGFQLFTPEEGPAPDHFTIHADPGRIKASWAADPEARIDIVAGLHYFNEILKIDSIDAVHGTMRVSGKETQELIRNGNHFFVSGVREELDTPGEWYLDSHAGRLYYWPLQGEDPNRSTFIAPKLDRLIELAGDLDGTARVRWLEFRGFTFEHVAASVGYVALRTPADAAVRLNGAWNCTIENCLFRNIDAYGIWLHLDTCENTIDGNTIEEMGGGGVVLTSAHAGYGEVFDPRPAVAGYAPLRNRFTRNHIHHGGRVRLCSAGFLLDSRPLSTALEPGNLIAFNHVHDMPRQGVFGFGNQGGNIVAYNYFHDLVTDSADAGAINFATMNNVAAPLLIENNVVRGVTGLLRSSEGRLDYFGGVGIYLDWGASHATVRNNIVEDTRFASLLINGGSWNRVENNIFADDTKTILMTPDGEAIGEGHEFSHNVVTNRRADSVAVWMLPALMAERLRKPSIPFASSDHNLFWNGGRPIDLPGMDRDSQVANPLLEGSGQTTRLRPDSPAWALGFRAIDAANTGIEAKAVEALDVRQLAVAHAIVRLTTGPGATSAQARPAIEKTARYMVYLRYDEKNPNRTLALQIDYSGGSARTTLNQHLSLGRVPATRWGIYIGEYEFAPGKQQGVLLDWQPTAGGSLPAEILFVEI